MKYPIIEIFDSLEGEGKRQGEAATFIRLAGCNLRCKWCDTTYSHDKNAATIMTAKEIIAECNTRFKRVTLTGGEPLAASHMDTLIALLSDKDFAVNVETNGSIDIAPFRHTNVFFSVDYKLPSSHETERMLWKNFITLRSYDVVKFVVGSQHDLQHMLHVLVRMKRHYSNDKYGMPYIYVTAVKSAFDMQMLAKAIMEEPILKYARLYTQLHKAIDIR